MTFAVENVPGTSRSACATDHWLTLLCVAGRRKAALRLAHRIDLDLVEMEVALARQLQPHISGLDPGKLDLQRLLVAKAVEHDARVLKNLPPRAVVVGSEHEQMGVARGHCVAAIEHQHAIDGHRPAQVNPPPGIQFIGRMEPPTAVLDAVTPAPGVLFRAYILAAGLNRWGRLAQFLLSQPIGRSCSGEIAAGAASAAPPARTNIPPSTTAREQFRFMAGS